MEPTTRMMLGAIIIAMALIGWLTGEYIASACMAIVLILVVGYVSCDTEESVD